MKALFLASALVLNLFSFAHANELDNETSVTNQKLTGTVVVRVDTRTQQAAVFKTDANIQNQEQALALTQENFSVIPQKNMRSELDRDGGASSWYFYTGYEYYSYMYWYGYWYTPSYTYSWGYYNYYYYANYWWR